MRFGQGAAIDCARFGGLVAARCALVCALPMIAMLTRPADLALMATLAALALGERVTEGRFAAAVAIALGGLAALVVLA
jgi:hypothetical protein